MPVSGFIWLEDGRGGGGGGGGCGGVDVEENNDADSGAVASSESAEDMWSSKSIRPSHTRSKNREDRQTDSAEAHLS